MFKINELIRVTAGKLIGPMQDISLSGISIDSRTIKPKEAFIAIKGDNFDGHDFILEAIKKGSRFIICQARRASLVSSCLREKKGIAFLEAEDTTRALGDIARFWRRQFDIPVIAITGSNGKTTTKDMIAWILSGKFKVLKNMGTKNNQIGLPLTLLNLDSSYDCVVLEAGTNHPGEIEYLSGICLANIGVITNIGPSHFEFLRDLKGVFTEKRTLLKFLKKPAIALLNADDNLLKKELAMPSKSMAAFGFGFKNHCDFSGSNIKFQKGRIEFLVQKYKFTLDTLGYFNAYNALAAIAAARILGMAYKDIASRLMRFSFPPARLNFVESKRLRFIDDTYNSNPASLSCALEALGEIKTKGRKIVIMGDMLELGKDERLFHEQAGKHIAKTSDAFIAVGRLSKIAALSAQKTGLNGKNVFTCETSNEARGILFKELIPNPDDIVLVKGSRLMRMEKVIINNCKT
ncbi:MAG: UDP-N-acetylmuramoyl-tripeptide--D-alanyl-D-alanine ligase [Candidatus Omnitrophota bacterium]|nr:UDP-N-acetylmuramoyl-tripeptide--D-alanyl-D-alanine ligase [Candidatus Omnitrophota bacterium]